VRSDTLGFVPHHGICSSGVSQATPVTTWCQIERSSAYLLHISPHMQGDLLGGIYWTPPRLSRARVCCRCQREITQETITGQPDKQPVPPAEQQVGPRGDLPADSVAVSIPPAASDVLPAAAGQPPSAAGSSLPGAVLADQVPSVGVSGSPMVAAPESRT
jgi:hypothetical protein